jgi:hypothetical protein
MLLWRRRNQRRRLEKTSRHTFPGIQFEKQEREHLQATASIATLDDADAIQLANSRPSQQEERITINPITAATTSILVGKSAIAAFMEDESILNTMQLWGDDTNGGNGNPVHVAYLRFATHLALYLDSLSVSTTPFVLDGVVEWKNELLILYVRYLGLVMICGTCW